MMSRAQRLEMAAFIQEADDVYTTKDGFGIICVKGDWTRAFVLDEISLRKGVAVGKQVTAAHVPDGGSAF